MTFDPIFPLLHSIIAASMLAILFVWLEWKKNSRFPIARYTAQLLMTGSVLAMILRPSFPHERDNGRIILLTENFSKEVVDSLVSQYPTAQLIRTPQADTYPNADVASSSHELDDQLRDVRFVVGDGLPAPLLNYPEELSYTFIPGKVPDGVRSIGFAEEPVVNRKTIIEGSINVSQTSKLVLKGPGGAEDSVTILTGNSSFKLDFLPKQSGNFVYHLEAIDSTEKLINSTPLPVIVQPEKKLKIFFLQDYPVAEVRYLKNFLSDHGHHVTIRYQLSRNVYRYEFANTEEKRPDKLDQAALNSFDLLIIDSDALTSISAMERQQLKQAIRTGLGMIILFNDVPSQNKSVREFTSVTFLQAKTDTTHANIPGSRNVVLKTLGESIKEGPNVRSTFTGNDKRIYSAFVFNGAGHIGFQLVTETFQFLNGGKTEVYNELWNDLLEKTSRIRQRPFRIRVLTSVPIYVDEPVDIEITSSGNHVSLAADTTVVALTEDILIDNRWLGKTWFNTSGWHRLIVPEDSTSVPLFIHDKENWRALRVTEQHRLNAISQTSLQNNIATTSIANEPISAWIFFVLFILSAGFLWLSPKL